MTKFKPYPEVCVDMASEDKTVFSIVTAGGKVLASSEDQETAERFAECWNVMRAIYAPKSHIDATEDYLKRLVEMRKAEELNAHRRFEEVSKVKNFDDALRVLMSQLKRPPPSLSGGAE